ncbi:DsbA family protein [Streptosporangium sp. NPDC020145]|uniref:2-hydroxychromene-2-carboxylate isomerase n=1 Tax=Streptosporangium sp. NPDC020145 TaxID=3154694 RepID=UPI003415887B
MRFYFSLRSPYSWLALHDLLNDYPGLAERLEWIPFWDPEESMLRELTEAGGEFGYATMPKAKHLYILQDVRRLARDRGLRTRWPLDREPRWEVPHLAYLVAADKGRGREFVMLASEMRWERGLDICAPEVVAEIATALDLPAGELAGAADRLPVREQAVQALLSAYRDGVFGVPFFVRRYDKYWGVDRLDAFAGSLGLRPAASLNPAEEHAGGCG